MWGMQYDYNFDWRSWLGIEIQTIIEILSDKDLFLQKLTLQLHIS